MMRLTTSLLLLAGMQMARAVGVNNMPDFVYGVNLGSWLVEEAWMMNAEWKAMGGEICSDCSTCAMTTGALTKKIGQQQANTAFQNHWATWIQQSDIDTMTSLGINAVRVPLGYWIVEGLVDSSQGEMFPQGAILELKRGLRLLKAANIAVLLDMHAMPGVQAINSMFAGICTSNPQFYQAANYNRALQWAAVMTAFIHLDPDFSNVYGLEAVNEPLADSSKTPGMQGYYDSFVKVVRSVEVALGVTDCPGTNLASALGVTVPSGLTGAALVAASSAATAAKSGATLKASSSTSSKRSTTTSKKATTTSKKTTTTGKKTSSTAKQPSPKTSSAKKHTFKVEDKGLKTKAARQCDAKPTNVKRAVELEARADAASAGDDSTLTGILGKVKGLSSAIDATNLAKVMSRTLAQAGIDFRSGPAKNLFSSALLATLDGVQVAGGAAGNTSNGLNAGQCIITNFHDKVWQWGGNTPANANSSAIGPQNYDQHPYYSFGGVADPNIDSYLQKACTRGLNAGAISRGNAPVLQGEFWVLTDFDATTQNMKDFGDAQKLTFAKNGGKGWYYWSFKTTSGKTAQSYTAAVNAGLLTKDPSALFNANVCDKYN